MSKFLVTGGAGFIGSHIVKALVKKGNSVRILDNFSSGKKENLSEVIKDIELIRGDIRNKNTCLKASRKIDFILHQAALKSVNESLKNPQKYNAVNIQGTLNMLEASRKNRVRNFVFASSTAVYGDAKRFPIREDGLLSPISPYALTKLAAEHYCKIFSHNYGLNTASLRYFNVFGPGQAVDDEYAGVIPKFITLMLNNKTLPIYGDGRQSRDFVYIEDVIQANILAAKKNLKGEVFNIATGDDHSILTLVDTLTKILSKDRDLRLLPRRTGDIFKSQADISKAKKILGFAPKVNFITGLTLTTRYFKGTGK